MPFIFKIALFYTPLRKYAVSNYDMVLMDYEHADFKDTQMWGKIHLRMDLIKYMPATVSGITGRGVGYSYEEDPAFSNLPISW